MSNEAREMTGYILFMNVGIGSRSEGFRPFIFSSDITVCRLDRVGDDEFLNESFVPFHGKYCSARGVFYPGGNLLRVEKIEELTDPFSAFRTAQK